MPVLTVTFEAASATVKEGSPCCGISDDLIKGAQKIRHAVEDNRSFMTYPYNDTASWTAILFCGIHLKVIVQCSVSISLYWCPKQPRCSQETEIETQNGTKR